MLVERNWDCYSIECLNLRAEQGHFDIYCMGFLQVGTHNVRNIEVFQNIEVLQKLRQLSQEG